MILIIIITLLAIFKWKFTSLINFSRVEKYFRQIIIRYLFNFFIFLNNSIIDKQYCLSLLLIFWIISVLEIWDTFSSFRTTVYFDIISITIITIFFIHRFNNNKKLFSRILNKNFTSVLPLAFLYSFHHIHMFAMHRHLAFLPYFYWWQTFYPLPTSGVLVY